MRLGRRRAHAGLALGAIAIIGFGALWQQGSDEGAGQDALRRAEQAARSNQPITAAQLTDKPFDRLVVIPGTAGAAEIRRAVGTDWGRADDLAYHCCDPAPIWAFVDDDEVVAFFRPSLQMSYGDHVAAGSYRPGARLSLRRSSRRPTARAPGTPSRRA